MTDGIVQDMGATAGLAFLSVALWTIRVAFTSRGRKALGSMVAAVEATVFAVAFSRLLSGIDSPHQVVAYGAGVAAGTMTGLLIDAALNPQLVRVDVVDPDADGVLVERLHQRGYPTTVSAGFGLSGEVMVVSVTLAESLAAELLQTIEEAAGCAFWTVSPVRDARPSPLPRGFAAVTDLRRRTHRGAPRGGGWRGASSGGRAPVASLPRCTADLQ